MVLTARTEFAAAVNQIAAERRIDAELVLETVRSAILAAYRKDYPSEFAESEELKVELDSNTGEVAIMHGAKNVTPPGFGRIAAQTAKQVILQRLRESQKSAILEDFQKKVGMLVNGMVQRIEGPIVIVDLGNEAEGIMPPQEQVFQDTYHPNQRLKFYVVGIREGARGSEIIVSRAHKALIAGLFRIEVPEISSGAVEIKEVAREAGSRTKVAVASNQPGVDPVGSCVGQKGVRVQAVINEVGDEKIDIIQWHPDVARFIEAALSPAKNIRATIDENSQTATVIVPDDQLSLAIGKGGQNVRLAAKLTGYKIDIQGETEVRGVGRTEAQAARAALLGEVPTEEPKKKTRKKTTKAQKVTRKTKK